MKYAIDGENCLYEDQTFNGKLLSDFRVNRAWPDGGRFDIGPNSIPGSQRDELFMGKWSAEKTGEYSVKIISPVPNKMGIEVSREYILNSHNTTLKVNQTMKNITDKTISRHFWNRTFCPAGGILTLPKDKNSVHPDDYQIMNDSTNKAGNRLSSTNCTIDFKALASAIKMGTDSKKGWISYSQNGLLITIKFHIDKKENYIDSENNTTIFYTNGIVVELEPVSPTYEIRPNEIVSFCQKWILRKV